MHKIILKEEAQSYLQEAANTFMKHTLIKSNGINDNYLKCVKRSLEKDDRIVTMCSLGKLYEEKLNKSRCGKVVAGLGSMLCSIGRWVGAHLKE